MKQKNKTSMNKAKKQRTETAQKQKKSDLNTKRDVCDSLPSTKKTLKKTIRKQ